MRRGRKRALYETPYTSRWGRSMPKHWRAIYRDICRQYPRADFIERLQHYDRVVRMHSHPEPQPKQRRMS